MKKILLLAMLLAAPVYAQQTIDPRLLPPGVPRQLQIDGTNILSNDPNVNFQDNADIDVTNPSSGNINFTIKPGAVTDSKVTSITTRAKLPAALAYEDENNTFTAQNFFNGLIRV